MPSRLDRVCITLTKEDHARLKLLARSKGSLSGAIASLVREDRKVELEVQRERRLRAEADARTAEHARLTVETREAGRNHRQVLRGHQARQLAGLRRLATEREIFRDQSRRWERLGLAPPEPDGEPVPPADEPTRQ